MPSFSNPLASPCSEGTQTPGATTPAPGDAVGSELSTRALKPARLAYLDITCQYEKHAGLLAFPFASSLAKVYFFKVNHRHAPRKNEVAGLLRAGAFGLGRRKVMRDGRDIFGTAVYGARRIGVFRRACTLGCSRGGGEPRFTLDGACHVCVRARQARASA